MNNTATTEQAKRLERDLNEYAKESVEVEKIGSTFYAFGSELACLRIFHKYNQVVRSEGTRTGYSENLKSFYFSIEPRIS